MGEQPQGELFFLLQIRFGHGSTSLPAMLKSARFDRSGPESALQGPAYFSPREVFSGRNEFRPKERCSYLHLSVRFLPGAAAARRRVEKLPFPRRSRLNPPR
jgi:hypothetical protein